MQRIAILSVNHQLAPVEVREKVAFASGELANALGHLNNTDGIEACAILSTCNRAEVYAIVDADNTQEILSDYLAILIAHLSSTCCSCWNRIGANF